MKSLVRFGALNANGHGYIDANAIISIAFTSNAIVTVTYQGLLQLLLPRLMELMLCIILLQTS
jgi:hypothetical protein